MQYAKNLISGFLSLAIMITVSTGFIYAQDSNQNQKKQNKKDGVVDVIQSSDDHTIFASLLEESGKIQELRNKESITVIAPTDEAFEQMDRDIEKLKNNPQALEDLIENHIVTEEERMNKLDRWDTRVNRDDKGNSVGVGGGDQVDALIQREEKIEASNGTVLVVNQVRTNNGNSY